MSVIVLELAILVAGLTGGAFGALAYVTAGVLKRAQQLEETPRRDQRS